jgi:hypothetical protein
MSLLRALAVCGTLAILCIGSHAVSCAPTTIGTDIFPSLTLNPTGITRAFCALPHVLLNAQSRAFRPWRVSWNWARSSPLLHVRKACSIVLSLNPFAAASITSIKFFNCDGKGLNLSTFFVLNMYSVAARNLRIYDCSANPITTTGGSCTVFPTSGSWSSIAGQIGVVEVRTIICLTVLFTFCTLIHSSRCPRRSVLPPVVSTR